MAAVSSAIGRARSARGQPLVHSVQSGVYARGRTPEYARLHTGRPTSEASTRTPVRPSSTSSGVPPTRVAITGRPAAIASSTTFGVPSQSDVSQNWSRSRRIRARRRSFLGNARRRKDRALGCVVRGAAAPSPRRRSRNGHSAATPKVVGPRRETCRGSSASRCGRPFRSPTRRYHWLHVAQP